MSASFRLYVLYIYIYSTIESLNTCVKRFTLPYPSPPLSPVLSTILGDLTFTKKNPDEGEETVASCSWTGSPDPDITWYKDGFPLIEGELPSRMRITRRREDDGTHHSSLEIDGVELSDTGEYTCNVSNPVGFVFRHNRLEVQGVCMYSVCPCTMCICTVLHFPQFSIIQRLEM